MTRTRLAVGSSAKVAGPTAVAAGVAGATRLVGPSATNPDGTYEAAGEQPYGVGSARSGGGGAGPSGWTVKGNEDSMLYHTPDSPSYQLTIAEIWFIDEQSAVRSGFSPWHKG